MKIKELVYNRPNLIRSQVGSVCFSFISFFSSNLCVYSVQCRQKVKLNNANVHSSIMKESAIIMCVQFSVGLRQWIHICVHMYILVCVCVRQRVHICVTVSMCRQGVGVSCVHVCRRPWMLSRLQLGTAMVHVQCRKQQEQATYRPVSYTHLTLPTT